MAGRFNDEKRAFLEGAADHNTGSLSAGASARYSVASGETGNELISAVCQELLTSTTNQVGRIWYMGHERRADRTLTERRCAQITKCGIVLCMRIHLAV